MRGYFEIGIWHAKTEVNVGTLWRSAYQLGASGIFTIGKRFKNQTSDTYKTYRHIPLREFSDFDQFFISIPKDCFLTGIEMKGIPLRNYKHPERVIYLLGAEDNGLPDEILERCHSIVSIEAVRQKSFNVAVAGSIVMYHRLINL